ncbi:energy transducer TonB [Poseidonibacter lekithochrous]|uniref:energy transducer TonB n=1 Tax=Poseidonibacter lekithochrous TaxID=1904463 RepID=UPI0008FC978C|nr:energy transducer TonB [Poseidonibacter lekithochrous]QKJ22840.1 TonB domain-containing protein [Poseidonibacter lekithochrous]
MKIIIFAFVVSISLHLLLFKQYKIEKAAQTKTNKNIDHKKSNVQFVKLKQIAPKPIKKEIKKVEPKKIVEIKKPAIKKPIVKKKVKKQITRTLPKKYIKTKKTVTYQKKRVKKPTPVKQVQKRKTIQEKTLEDFLSQKEPVNNKVLNELQRLYGREYQTFTKVQKAYLEKNLNNFQVITQRVLTRLGYPKLAAKLRLSGKNIVEFMYYPNGNIKNLKITNSSGYAVFDDYSLKLIEIAYKDYPRPKTPTKLKFQVHYRIY